MAVGLPEIWAFLIAFAILTYTMFDGFDLGVGILFPTARSESERTAMMNSVAPVWDGNETWLVLGGGGLFSVFPLAYSIVMPALYMPIIIMLMALIFRGVSFEYRWRVTEWRTLWDRAFFGGSIVAAFCQGVVVGALVQGIEVENRAYAGGAFDWLSLFSICTGLAVVTGYTLLGATWLNVKTEGALQMRMRRYAPQLGVALLTLMAVVALLTPLSSPLAGVLISTPRVFALLAVIVVLLVLGRLFFAGMADGRELQPFFCSLGFFVCAFICVGFAFYPLMIPPDVSIREAAAPDSSLAFALVGALIMVPIILAYTGYTYWVFRGKVDPSKGYH